MYDFFVQQYALRYRGFLLRHCALHALLRIPQSREHLNDPIHSCKNEFLDLPRALIHCVRKPICYYLAGH